MTRPLQSEDPLPDTTQQQAASSSQETADATKAATHLANERTFVAWSCVGVLLIVTGVVTARVSQSLNTNPLANLGSDVLVSPISSTIIGLSFLAAGVVLIVLACYRFLKVQKQIEEDSYQASSFLALAFLCLILVLSSVLMLNLLEVGSR